jgi:hypothetical protein
MKFNMQDENANVLRTAQRGEMRYDVHPLVSAEVRFAF